MGSLNNFHGSTKMHLVNAYTDISGLLIEEHLASNGKLIKIFKHQGADQK